MTNFVTTDRALETDRALDTDEVLNNVDGVDWGAILAGTAIALAISSIMFAFGSAIGLSLSSFAGHTSSSFTALIIGAALWFLWVQVSSFVAGGYVTGRLRRRATLISNHESELQDGSHGLAAWAVAVIFGALLAGSVASSAGHGILQAVDTGYYADQLVAGGTVKPGAPTPDTASIQRILTKSASNRALTDGDKAALSQSVSADTGLSDADAQKRVDSVLSTLKTEADQARKIGILLAFLTAASLLVGAVAAWWSAVAGGKHRSDSMDHRHLTSWR